MNIIVLQNLIKSLSKSEKKTFSLITNIYEGDKKYYMLYEYLKEKKEIDIERLEKKFGKNGLETARKHLSSTLMKALRYAEDENSVENQIFNDIRDAKILHTKGFISESLELLLKIKQTALSNELFSYYLMASRLELEYITRMQFTGIDEYELIEKQKKIEEIIDHEILLRRHSSLMEILLIRYWRKGALSTTHEKIKLNDLLLEEHQILSNKSYNSFESKKIHLNFQSTYFMMIGDPEGSLNIFYEINSLFKKNMRMRVTSDSYYIYMLDGILTNLRAMNKNDEMPFFINQLSGITPHSDDLKVRTGLLIFYHQLIILNDQRDFKNALNIIEKEPIIDTILNGPIFNLQAQICLAISTTYFGSGNFKRSIFFQNFMLNNYKKKYSYRLYFQLRVLYIMTQFELKNYDYLEYELKSFERKIKTESQLNFLEKSIIDLFKKLLKNTDNNNTYNKIREEFNFISFSPEDQRVVQNLQLNTWLNKLLQL